MRVDEVEDLGALGKGVEGPFLEKQSIWQHFPNCTECMLPSRTTGARQRTKSPTIRPRCPRLRSALPLARQIGEVSKNAAPHPWPKDFGEGNDVHALLLDDVSHERTNVHVLGGSTHGTGVVREDFHFFTVRLFFFRP